MIQADFFETFFYLFKIHQNHERKKSIELLNKAVGEELTAVHQYMYFHFHCDDQGMIS